MKCVLYLVFIEVTDNMPENKEMSTISALTGEDHDTLYTRKACPTTARLEFWSTGILYRRANRRRVKVDGQILHRLMTDGHTAGYSGKIQNQTNIAT